MGKVLICTGKELTRYTANRKRHSEITNSRKIGTKLTLVVFLRKVFTGASYSHIAFYCDFSRSDFIHQFPSAFRQAFCSLCLKYTIKLKHFFAIIEHYIFSLSTANQIAPTAKMVVITNIIAFLPFLQLL